MDDALEAISAAKRRIDEDRRSDEDRRIVEVIQRERRRLFNFIRTRVDHAGDAEDILQDVFYEFVEAYRMMKPVEEAGAWLYRVARNRIIDVFRRKRSARAESVSNAVVLNDEDARMLEELLPSPERGPDAAYARRVLLEELDTAIEELPEDQRQVFIANEIDGRSFKELAEETGLNLNTLISRKRYAVLQLRKRLRAIHEEFKDGTI